LAVILTLMGIWFNPNMNKTTVPVVVSRFIDAPPQRVYDAWLIPQNASKWLFATPTGHMIRAEIEPKVGGRFRFTDRRDGEDVDHVGKFVELLPSRRVAFTFTVPRYSKEETLVRVDISAKGKGTKIVLTHEGVLPELSAKTMEGWMRILDGLSKEVSA
jgi:uncharacterized protein YndB with AHSA1/START domain